MSCLNTLKERGLRLTPQRRLIAEIIHNAHSHLAAEDIISFVQNKMPGVNKSTIYRTLDILEQAGCVLKSESGGHFIYHHAEEGHHHHLVCIKCGQTIECPSSAFSEVERSLAEEYGFIVNFQHVVIKGVCQSCKTKAS